MGKTIMSKIKWLLTLCAVTVLALVGGMFSLNTKAEAKAEESITITQVQFRTSGESCFFFLRMDGQTDYTELNQWHDPSMITNTNILDKVHLYFLDGSATLREAWTGTNCGTYIWGETHALVFPMQAEYKSNMGTGARIDTGAEIPMLDGTKKATSVTRTFWSTHNTADNAIGNYTDGYNTISTSIAKLHLRGRINIGLGEGNDWVKGVGRTDVLPTQVPGADGTNAHSGTYWRKMLACNFLGKVKLHVKETDTWVTLGSILNYNPEARQLTYYFNNWGETGGTMQIDINTAYNGTTIDQILFEKGCEFPSYDYLGNADMAYTVQVLDAEYLCTSNDMSQAEWAVSWSFEKFYEVTYLNEDGSVYTTQKYKQGETIALPAIPEKAGYEGAWTMAGGEVPTMMPANHVTLQLKYEEKIVVQPKVTQVQFRTSGNEYYFFLRFNTTDYVTPNQAHDASFITKTNLLDNVTIYMEDGIYSLREIWDGVTVTTYRWGDDNTLTFKMKAGFIAKNGMGARIAAGAEIPMVSGEVLTTDVSRTFWTTSPVSERPNDFVINSYIEGYKEIETTIEKVHLRGVLLVGLGEGNDWNGKGEALPTQVKDANGSSAYANLNWSSIMMYMVDYQTKIKLHIKETDTWVTLGEAMDTMGNDPQWMFVFNGWGEEGGIMRISINSNLYNGTTVDKILFEKGCELPSYDMVASASAGHVVHVLTEDFILSSNDMSNANWAVDWTRQYKVTFNGENAMYVNPNATVEYPMDLSETKEETDTYYYIYNWFLNGEIYDFSTPITSDINLTSDGSFTAVAKPVFYEVAFDPNNGYIETTVTVGGGELVTPLEAPEKTGNGLKYEFLGWYHNGELFDFNTPIEEDISLVAVYRETKLLVISDLYDGSYADEILKTGEIKVESPTANRASTWPVGCYVDQAAYPNFELAFDFKYDKKAAAYSTFTIQLKSDTDKDNNTEFFVGWKIWFTRDGASLYFQYLNYNPNGENGDVRNAFGAWDSGAHLTPDTIYSAKIGYKVLDAATGKVEMCITLGEWSNSIVYDLGAEYFENYSSNNIVLFSSESSGGEANVTLGDPGLIGKARQDITFMDGDTTYATDLTNQIVLPTIPSKKTNNGLTQVFVGWTTDASFGDGYSLYPAGYKLQLDAETTLYAVWIGFEMQDGAAVRLATNSSGIRFLVDIDDAGYQTGVSLGLIADIGTILVPTNYLANTDFVHGNFPSGYYSEVTKAKTELAGNNWKWTGENGVKTYAAAFVGLNAEQYARVFSARGFLKVNFTTGVGYVYTDYVEENNARSIYEVATSAYNDTEEDYKNNAVILGYVNSVLDIVLDANHGLTKNENSVGMYEITSTVDADTYTFTVSVDNATEASIKTVIINGVRLVEGSDKNIVIGDFAYAVKDYTLSKDGKTIQFVLGAAETLDGKQSDGLVYFQSSDDDLNFFLNDYVKRHAGNIYENGVDQKVNSVAAGNDAQEFFWQEWFSLAYYPISNLQDGSDARIEGMREKLSGVPVDDYGYVWQNTDAVRDVNSTLSTGEHRMGWPFPTSKNTEYKQSEKYLWATHTYDSSYSTSWDFNGADRLDGWTSNIGASVAKGMLSANVSNQTGNITFTSPTLHTSHTQNSPSTTSWSSWTHTTTCMVAYYTPLLELDVRMDNASSVADIVVEYTSTKGSGSVSVNEKAFIKYPYEGKYEHMLFLPMYAEANWGDDKDTYITSITVKIVLKSGQSMTGNVGMSYVRGAFDTRHTDNVTMLVSSLRQDYDYTGDLDYLKANITRARKGVNFLMQGYNAERGLIRSDYLVGHDSDKSTGKYVTDNASSLGNGYWDISFMPEYDFHTNTYFYMALSDLAYLEGVLEREGNVDKAAATILTANRDCVRGTSAYNYDSASLNELANTVKAALQADKNDSTHTGFWDTVKGRFVAGYSEKEGRWYDYGYVAWNMEAAYYGVATEAQTKLIMDWVSGKRVIEGDTSKGEDIYFFELAPRTNTYQGTSKTDMSIYTGIYVERNDLIYGVTQVQNGGAIMYTSYYDLMNRLEVYGADNAYERLQAIQAWYMDIYEYYTTENAGASPDNFYWDYYENSQWDSDGDGKGEYWKIQNGIKGMNKYNDGGGIIGIDGEFLESILPMASIYYGFFGINVLDNNVLQIAPKLPGVLEYWTTENLTFCDVKYDLTIRNNALQLSSISAEEAAKGLSMQVVFDAPLDDYKVYVNGFVLDESKYTVEGGKIYINVALDNVIVEVR